LANELIDLLGRNQHQIRVLQSLLNLTPQDGLEEEAD